MIKLDIPKKFYITTPIYYLNGKLHLGHAYTTIVADCFARYYRLLGSDVFFLTGTDEHGLKIQHAALEKNMSIESFLEDIYINVKSLWKELNISYDYFIRTTDKNHIDTVTKIINIMKNKGDIYKGFYEGYYCKSCEAFYTDKDIINNKCPEGHDVFLEKEEAYFFKLNKYQDFLLDFYNKNPSFLKPDKRKNEIINFVKNGLDDLCISRKNVTWGIKLPFDNNFTIYVWLDALFNYVSALGYPDSDNFKKYWPVDFQLMGKEIYRFHTVYWPIFLKSVDLEIPKIEFAHGWWTSEGKKMSKSFGNVVYVQDYIDKYGVDAFRYYVLREISFGEDGSFYKSNFIDRINTDLVANIGNLVSRVTSLAIKRNKEEGFEFYKDEIFVKIVEQKIELIHSLYQSKELTKVVSEIFTLSSIANKYVQDKEPWVLLKENVDEFDKVIYVLLETIRIIAVELSPILTNSWKKILYQLGIDFENKANLKLEFTNICSKKKIIKGNHLFEKIDN
ncbi:MAG: methionine--tRNA ligase [Candidatus ainarchaeum sp.]|nr:methionine--tRNA ligase [Candidatus ainarchaeum sp.]MDD3975634.1 methionine--tRNA ligase [Candidatus ainarchaeum sp.]